MQPNGKGPGAAGGLTAEHEPAVAPGGQEGQWPSRAETVWPAELGQ